MSSDLRREAVRLWWAKAEDSLVAASRECEYESYVFAVNRLYYAAFYAATAALLDRELSFKKHAGVRAAFHQHFIKSGLLDVRWAHVYDRLFEDRQEGDYVVAVSFARDYVETQLGACRDFLAELRPHVRALD